MVSVGGSAMADYALALCRFDPPLRDSRHRRGQDEGREGIIRGHHLDNKHVSCQCSWGAHAGFDAVCSVVCGV